MYRRSLRVPLRDCLHVQFDGDQADCEWKFDSHHDDAEAPAHRVEKRHILRDHSAGILPQQDRQTLRRLQAAGHAKTLAPIQPQR